MAPRPKEESKVKAEGHGEKDLLTSLTEDADEYSASEIERQLRLEFAQKEYLAIMRLLRK